MLIELKDVGKVLWKEFRISAVIGIVLAIINFGKIMLIDGETMLVALTVSISILIVVVFAKLIGGLLPMAAKKMKIDPALMATPMISSITDMVSVVIYLLLATAIMGITI